LAIKPAVTHTPMTPSVAATTQQLLDTKQAVTHTPMTPSAAAATKQSLDTKPEFAHKTKNPHISNGHIAIAHSQTSGHAQDDDPLNSSG
jgi:hypothetical protein